MQHTDLRFTESCHKQNLFKQSKSNRQGQANPIDLKYFYRKHVTVYADNLRTTRDCPEGNVRVHSETCDYLGNQPACAAKFF